MNLKTNPKITIVTIIYNLINSSREKTIRQCIESVHNQRYKNIEHIIIDGASNDGTLALIQEYVDKGWIICYSEPDTGIYNAMNKGLAKATGDYICYLNSDDFFHNENGVKETVKVLKKTKADFAYSHCKYLNEKNDNKVGTLLAMPESFYIRMPFSHQTLFVSTDIMKRLNGFDEQFKSAGDYDFIIRMFLSGGRGAYVPCNFVSYRLGGLSDCNQQQSINEVIKLYKKNYTKYTSGEIIDWGKMYHNLVVNEKLFNNIAKSVDVKLATQMKKCWAHESFIDNKNKQLKLYSHLVLENNHIKNFLNFIFSIKNEFSENEKHKVITILGIKIKFKLNDMP